MKRLLISTLVLLATATSLFAKMSDREIGSYLKGYSESGYKYVRELKSNEWQVKFTMSDWEYNWNVYVETFPNSVNDDYDIIQISTVIESYGGDQITSSFLQKILQANLGSPSYGSFALQSDDEDYQLFYVVKITRGQLTQNSLISSIGYVAGYANSIYPSYQKN